MFEHLDQSGLVERRIGVGRTREAGDPACDRRRDFGLECRLVFESGLSQPRGEIDQPGADDESRRIEHAIGAPIGRRLADRRNFPGRDIHGRRSIDAMLRIDQPAATDLYLHRLPARMLITAMRTAMPNVT